MPLTSRLAAATAIGAVGAVVLSLGPANAGPVADPAGAGASAASSRQQAFARAAKDFGVPESVLLAVSYNESRWEAHRGAPSTSGGYGLMHLTDVPASSLRQAKGDGAGPVSDAPSLHTLRAAAQLTGASTTALKTDPGANVRGGAALLASYADALGGASATDPSGWYAAVAKYSGSGTDAGARAFADNVYATIRAGAAQTTTDGQTVRLAAQPAVRPATTALTALKLAHPAADPQIECPSGLDCDFVPAAYEQNSADPGDYGNYDFADRPRDMKINYIVMHDTEESYEGTLGIFTNPLSYVSAHYVVRSGDGHVTQMVPTKNVAWQAGNWYINMHSVGIEQEGFAISGADWYTESLYHSSARLVRYLAAKYHVPLDRQHIIGHDNVPGTLPTTVAGMHWDPGPFWDWGHFMTLLGRPIFQTATSHSNVVTIRPRFDTNLQHVTDCEQSTEVPDQGTSFVYLHTAASDDAPLVSDPALHPDGTPGTTCGNDWGDKASAGQQFVVAGRQGDWTAIWWGGTKAWFHNPANARTAVPAFAKLIKPKSGLSSIPVYGRAYPEEAAYAGTPIPYQTVTPLQYTIAAGQAYVTGGSAVADYYYSKTIDDSNPMDDTVVIGHDRYLVIQLGHRIAFVRAADVDVVWSHF